MATFVCTKGLKYAFRRQIVKPADLPRRVSSFPYVMEERTA